MQFISGKNIKGSSSELQSNVMPWDRFGPSYYHLGRRLKPHLTKKFPDQVSGGSSRLTTNTLVAFKSSQIAVASISPRLEISLEEILARFLVTKFTHSNPSLSLINVAEASLRRYLEKQLECLEDSFGETTEIETLKHTVCLRKLYDLLHRVIHSSCAKPKKQTTGEIICSPKKKPAEKTPEGYCSTKTTNTHKKSSKNHASCLTPLSSSRWTMESLVHTGRSSNNADTATCHCHCSELGSMKSSQFNTFGI
ncbi:Uncharacterized protein Rs2_27609 [Raphanus sativus]|nr:Uncharacterized protein Rs2_27609 [Raphanus sativus]